VIYLVQPEKYLNTNIYKIGMSHRSNDDRTKSYGTNANVLFIMQCNRPFNLENQIKLVFMEKFKLHSGKEYFEGNETEILNTFIALCVEYRVKHCIGKDVINNLTIDTN
jgi:hypothetical protein